MQPIAEGPSRTTGLPPSKQEKDSGSLSCNSNEKVPNHSECTETCSDRLISWDITVMTTVLGGPGLFLLPIGVAAFVPPGDALVQCSFMCLMHPCINEKN